MDCQSTNIFQICKEFGIYTINSINEIDNNLKEQTMKLDVLYNDLLQSVKNDQSDNVSEKKLSKRQSKNKNGQVGDLFAEPSFQQPAVPHISRSKRQASIVAMDKIKAVRESSTISSGAFTRASRARAISSDVDIAHINLPKANSTFVVDKKFKDNIEECLSPEMFSSNNDASKPSNFNETYNMPTKSTSMNTTKILGKHMNLIPEESPISTKKSKTVANQSLNKCSSKTNNESSMNKQREKLEDIDVNIDEPSKHMTRTTKRKLQEENYMDSKKTNVIHVPLEHQISTPLKTSDDLLPTLHQIRENEAEKRKELYLKAKADQKKFDKQHLKAAKQREEQLKVTDEKIKKIAEMKRIKEEKQKEKELKLKEEALKKQKKYELRLVEVMAKRKIANQKRLEKNTKSKIPDIEVEHKEKEIKKKPELIPVTSKQVQPVVHPKVTNPNLPTSSAPKVMPLPILKKIVETETNLNDYGLNDVSARDSSEDESGPKKPVPEWAKQENRKTELELQYHLDSKERDIFFDCPKKVSLKVMFKGWNIKDRQRTSSAVWDVPVRYSEYIRKHLK